jgi:hypothetical protein
MKKVLASALVLAWIGWASARTTYTAPQTWTGIVSDAMCNGDHGGEVDEKECTEKCMKNGDKLVLVTDFGKKIWQIANQNFPGLSERGGSTVKVTGELKGDAITISKVEKP